MPKQLCLDEGLGNCTAGNGDERLLRPVTQIVNGPGDELFACSTLARDEDERVQIRDPADQVVNDP